MPAITAECCDERWGSVVIYGDRRAPNLFVRHRTPSFMRSHLHHRCPCRVREHLLWVLGARRGSLGVRALSPRALSVCEALQLTPRGLCLWCVKSNSDRGKASPSRVTVWPWLLCERRAFLCVLCAWAGAGAQQAHRMSWLEEVGASVSLLSCAV